MSLEEVQQSLAAVEDSLTAFGGIDDEAEDSRRSAESNQSVFDTLMSDLGRLATATERAGGEQEIDGVIWQLSSLHEGQHRDLRSLYGYGRTVKELRGAVVEQARKRAVDSEYRARQADQMQTALRMSPHIRMRGINS